MNCVIIHGCPKDVEKAKDPRRRTYDKNWIPWTKNLLESRGVKTKVPLMPEPWAPVYEKYKEILENLEINEQTILVGHSCGCSFIVRWLGDSGKYVSKVILVAPWKIAVDDNKDLSDFYNFQVKSKIINQVKNIIYFTSDNERRGGLESLNSFYSVLGGKIILLKNRGHYTSEDMRTVQFPELIKAILEQ